MNKVRTKKESKEKIHTSAEKKTKDKNGEGKKKQNQGYVQGALGGKSKLYTGAVC